MRAPSEIIKEPEAHKQGDVVYWWTNKHYRECRFIRAHADPPAVKICDGFGEIIVPPHEIISAFAYLNEKREDVRARYVDIIRHWESGIRKTKEIASLIGESPRAAGQKIATAKRWKFIDDKAPSKETGTPVSEGLGQRP